MTEAKTEPTSSDIDSSDEISALTGGLDDVVHQRVRLGILTIASEAKQVEFRFLLDTLRLTTGNLSQHLRVLEDAGLIQIKKAIEGRRPKTWIVITKSGRTALHREISTLKDLVRRVERLGPSTR